MNLERDQLILTVVFCGLVVAVALAWESYARRAAHDRTLEDYTLRCRDDAYCLDVLDDAFDRCFDASYQRHGRRSSAVLDRPAMDFCLNRVAEEELFD